MLQINVMRNYFSILYLILRMVLLILFRILFTKSVKSSAELFSHETVVIIPGVHLFSILLLNWQKHLQNYLL